jgi:plasmid maintenance system killer protein
LTVGPAANTHPAGSTRPKIALLLLEARRRVATPDQLIAGRTSTAHNLSMAASNMITSFKDELTEQLFRTGGHHQIPAEVAAKAVERFDWLDAAASLMDIAAPNGMRFHKWAEGGSEWFQVHVKDTWWIVFHWLHPNCEEVQIVKKR